MKVKIISVFPVKLINDKPETIDTVLGVQVKYEYNSPILPLKDISIENITPEKMEEIEKKLKQKEINVEIEKKPNEDDVSIEELTKLITEHIKQAINN
jgi:hypothetical protein